MVAALQYEGRLVGVAGVSSVKCEAGNATPTLNR